ncbi:unnamed protein product [Rodentolepis nana]|uniref:Peptidase_M4_C domain-containing protein n=1 Tax=Rodentolepis nana TaxID=102285 RepID=A0A0R3T2F1_RODNA|nr:unnamed protein product [Rodentolepis nana]
MRQSKSSFFKSRIVIGWEGVCGSNLPTATTTTTALYGADPVNQIASELVGNNGHKLWRNEVQSSVFEHAAQLIIAETYDDSYAACYAKSVN